MIFNAETSVYVLFGDPVSHSLSPVMHNRAFEYTGFNGVYFAFRVKDIKNALMSLKALGIKGASITIPHKAGAIKYLDGIDDISLKIGAVNTIINTDGYLKGFNSDWLGAVRALSEKTDIRGKRIALLGAGGAARAVGFGMKEEGGIITVLNRSRKNGEQLAKELSAEYRPLNEIGRSGYDILINTTPLGMKPDTDKMPVGKNFLEKGMVVMDIVYNPQKTRLLDEADKAGCITVEGISMFIYQGAFQFELWTGMKAPVDAMREAVLNALAG